ncbi:hypothetical protein [Nonlabens tegetincola]|uniref:hypothetical protein n=1 Tax=Nonlabens tegetincola TaxID=323273 RepID=UPI0030C84008
MKKTVITAAVFMVVTALAMAGNEVINAKIKDGVYTSDHGDIHILNSRSNKKTVGLYKGVGHLLLSNFTISGRGRVYTGSFSNGKKIGQVSFTPQSNQAWKGDWKWKTTTGRNKWDGKWDGTFKTSSKLKGLHMWNTFKTDFGTLDLIHNPEGKVAGFLYKDGQEYFVHGGFSGGSQMKFYAYISNSEDTIKTSGPFDIVMDWDYGLYGTITSKGRQHTNIRGSENGQTVNITLQTIKNYKNRGLMHGEERGKVTISASLFDEKGRHWTHTLYKDQSNITYKENKEKQVDKQYSNLVNYYNGGKGYYKNPILNLNFTHKRLRSISNASDRLVAHSIPMKDILDYLTYKRNSNSFQNAPDGRKKISNSDHTFWLSESNGKRKVRGYAFIKYGNNDKWAYFYTIQLN